MHICLAAAGEIFGGAERQIITLIEAMESHSFTVLLFYEGRLASELRGRGVSVNVLPRRRALDRNTVTCLRQLFLDNQFDILHIHGYLPLIYCFLVRCSLPPSIIKTEHGLPEIPLTGLRRKFRSKIVRRLERIATQQLNCYIVFVTNELAGQLKNNFPQCEQTVIHNGLGPVQTSTESPHEFHDFRTNFVCAGRLEPVKGFDIAINAFAPLAKVHPDWALHIYGEGPELGNLKHQITAAGAMEQIFLHGSRDNVADRFEHADVALIPSRHEGLPYVLLEYMRSQCVVIAAEVGGLKEVLQDGHTCYFFPSGNTLSLRRAMEKAIESPDLSSRISANARALQESHYSARSMADQYTQLFSELIDLTGEKAI